MIKQYLRSSIGRKQIVAVTGLLLVGFLVFHLSMNLLIFAGAELYNFFPTKAHESGIMLRLLEAGLAAIFFTHIGFTIALVRDNRKARSQNYAMLKPKRKRSLATRLMPYTGMILLVFLIVHIKDFVLIDHHNLQGFVGEENLGLYGVVHNAFANSIARTIGYIVAMFAVGFHLAHGIQSVCQSFGLNHESYTPTIQKVSTAVGVVFAVAFSSIPAYMLFQACKTCQ